MKKKKKRLKKILIILGSTLLFFLLVVSILVSLFFYRKPLVKGLVEKQIEKRTGIPITIGALDYRLFPLRIEAGAIAFSTKLGETEVDVFIEKLVLNGNIDRIRKKRKPYFTTIRAEGVRITSNIKQAREKVRIEDMLRYLSSGMTYVRRISLKKSSFELNFPAQKLILEGTDITFAASKSPVTFAYSFYCRNVEGTGRPQGGRFQNSIQGSGTLSLEDNPALDGQFLFTSNHLSYAEKEGYLDEIRMIFAAEIQEEKKEFFFPSLEIEVPSIANLTGSLVILARDELTLHFRPSLRIPDLGRFASLAKDHLPEQLDGLELDGSAFFEGEAQFAPAHPGQKANISGLAVLNPSRIAYRTPDYRFNSQISGNFKIEDFPSDQDISGRLNVANSSFAGKALEASGVNMDVPFVYDSKGSQIRIPGLKTSASTLSLDISNRKFEFESPSLSGQGLIGIKNKQIRISKANIELQPFPPFEVEAHAGLDPRDPVSFSAKSSGIEFRTLRDFFSFAIPPEIEDWEPDGRLDIRIEARNAFRENEQIWEVSAGLEAFDVRFHNPPFTVAGESLHPNLTVEGSFDRNLDEITFSVDAELSQGESLWRDFYIEWSEMPIQGTISGRFHRPRKELSDVTAKMAIPDFGTIEAGGHLDLKEPRSADLRIEASALKLSSLYAFINHGRIPGQTPTELEGQADAQIHARFDKNAFSLAGHLKVRDASWRDADGNLAVQGIEASIPIHYEKSALNAKDKAVSPQKGYLAFRNIRSPSLNLFPIKIEISSKKNGFMARPFEVDIFGLKADVGETSIEYGAGPLIFKARTSFSLKDADLSKLPFASQDFRPQGKLSMDLPFVEISPDRISTQGKGEANAFGGNIAIENIQVIQPFSKNRTISCDVKLLDLDLEKITDSIAFGRVTGIMNGEIKGLALSYGQPERFDIRIESIKKKGVPQRFSLKATNDLAILGTGEKTPFSSKSGWTKFVKEFRYNKIGIACSLKNDIFSLQGTIRKKGIEYLVKGSGLFAINVVNKQTRNQIQFKDMLNRIKRIGQSQ
jgi:hypothetical protein